MDNTKEKNIIVIGDVMLDIYWHGLVKRISPEAPVPILNLERIEYKPGGAANVASCIAAFDKKVSIIGACGNDENGNALVEILDNKNMEMLIEKSENFSTISKLRVISDGNHMIRIDDESLINEIPKEINFKEFLQNTYDSVVIFSDYNKGLINSIYKNQPNFIKDLKNNGNMIIVDPKGEDFMKYKHSSVITPNLLEFENIVGKCSSENDFQNKAKKLRLDLDIDFLIVTRGEDGMAIFGESFFETIEAARHDVVDVTGAGDTVIAFLAIGLSNNLSILDSAKTASIAAGIAVTRLGCASITPDDLSNATAH